MAVPCRPAAAAPIQSLAWEFPYAAGMAQKSKHQKTTPPQNQKKRMLQPSQKLTQKDYRPKGKTQNYKTPRTKHRRNSK